MNYSQLIKASTLLCLMATTGFSTVAHANNCDQFADVPKQYADCMQSENTLQKCLDNCATDPHIDNSPDFCACKCNGGIKLNTNIPFIGRCIQFNSQKTAQKSDVSQVTQTTAFPILLRALINIMLTLILLASGISIIIGGVMIASSGANTAGYEQGKGLIKKVVIGLIVLGCSGLLLSLINPNFFG